MTIQKHEKQQAIASSRNPRRPRPRRALAGGTTKLMVVRVVPESNAGRCPVYQNQMDRLDLKKQLMRNRKRTTQSH